MAIRAIKPGVATQNDIVVAAFQSGWRDMGWGLKGTGNVPDNWISMSAFQPARLSRPGNLGTAYIGVWTGNRSDT